MFHGLQAIIIDPKGYVSFEFDTFDQRADFMYKIPHGECYGKTHYNITTKPPYRVTFYSTDYLYPFIIKA